MDSCLITLGITLPLIVVSSKRNLTTRCCSSSQQPLLVPAPRFTIISPARDSLLGLMEKSNSCCSPKEDDDTASTLSTSTSMDDSSMTDFRQVTFAEDLVTAVHYRPTTTRQEKYYLHYNEHDYRDFKYEYVTGNSRQRKVQFALDLVTQVISIPAPSRKLQQTLYYSETELQAFLDDFVLSLHQRL
jgi:hypothetical protein